MEKIKAFFSKHKLERSWTNKKMAFISILIATSVAFVLVFVAIIPLTALPQFKLAIGGLPIKLTGYIFGPIVGGLTGLLSDLISFMFVPTYYHYYYTIAWIAAGFVPGMVGFMMNRSKRKRDRIARENNENVIEQYSIANFIVTLFVLATVFFTLFTFIYMTPEETFALQKLITSKYVFMALTLIGVATIFVGLIIVRFILKAKTFNALLPIVVLTVILELINTPLLGLGDQRSTLQNASLITTMTPHLLMSPLKMWGNIIIISVAFRILSPLIYNKTNNGWNK
ncbi:ECF transporter S component [Candidatus Mycoplasma mahonii]|uniref:ECF transporter S component n=1 Tax=Candidatus Mycoplasma mahonii TaxID=3004105 RepID=UPI0026ED92A9|nr:ECF transporter S component [Candidatus Mycoplasma mahonii]WKX02647.1 ECF transporter S component [Candidatus Mycoplasma mahonii]